MNKLNFVLIVSTIDPYFGKIGRLDVHLLIN
jgi:hypothetical protein